MSDAQAFSSDPQDIRAILAIGFGLGYFAVFAALLYSLWNGHIDVDGLMIIFGSITSSVMVSVTWYFASKTSETSS